MYLLVFFMNRTISLGVNKANINYARLSKTEGALKENNNYTESQKLKRYSSLKNFLSQLDFHLVI